MKTLLLNKEDVGCVAHIREVIETVEEKCTPPDGLACAPSRRQSPAMAAATTRFRNDVLYSPQQPQPAVRKAPKAAPRWRAGGLTF